jgi:hypothetical protein
MSSSDARRYARAFVRGARSDVVPGHARPQLAGRRDVGPDVLVGHAEELGDVEHGLEEAVIRARGKAVVLAGLLEQVPRRQRERAALAPQRRLHRGDGGHRHDAALRPLVVDRDPLREVDRWRDRRHGLLGEPAQRVVARVGAARRTEQLGDASCRSAQRMTSKRTSPRSRSPATRPRSLSSSKLSMRASLGPPKGASSAALKVRRRPPSSAMFGTVRVSQIGSARDG